MHRETSLSLGDLVGNRFQVVLREFSPQTEEKINDSVESFRSNGFVNYFGLQRFGVSEDSTHHVGYPRFLRNITNRIAVLKGDFDRAVDLIMRPKESGILFEFMFADVGRVLAARTFWKESNDVTETLKIYPHSRVAERAILTCFSKTGKVRDCKTAFSKIPKNIRLIYLHAYQSFIWYLTHFRLTRIRNHMASFRLEKFGEKPVVGDIVLSKGPEAFSSGGRNPISVEFVTIDNIHQFSLSDVVLPMAGWDIQYPKNEVGEQYRRLMLEDGIDNLDMKRKERDHSLPGTYRTLVAMASNVEAEFLRYSDPEAPLIRSDIDVINCANVPISEAEGDKLAVVLSFDLPKACYATMAVREICDCQGNAF